MSKKLITACMALFALAAFALPVSATASPVVTHPTGTRWDPTTGECTGVKGTVCVKATNVGETILFNGAGTEELVKCSTAIMTGYMFENSGTSIKANIHTATFSGTGGVNDGMNECTGISAGGFGNLTVTTNGGGVDENTVANGTPYCLTSGASDTFKIRGGLCSQEQRPITFIFATTLAGNCKYERSAAIEGTVRTDKAPGEDAILSVVKGAGTTFTGEAGNSFLCPANGSLQMSFTLETDTPTAEAIYIS